MDVVELKPFGARLDQIDPDNPEHIQAFSEAYRKYGFVMFHKPGLTEEQHLRLMSSIGTVAADRPGAGPVAALDHKPEEYKGFDPTNSNPGKFDDGELLFHFDFAFNDDWPCDAISLYGITFPPEGGDTLFVHGSDAYERLSDELKNRIEGKKAIHVFDPYKTNGAIRTRESHLGRYAERGLHAVVRPNPEGSGPALAVALSSADRIAGMPEEESEALLNELFSVLYDKEHIFRHKWTPGDFIVWNNHYIQHSREHFDRRCRRTIRRVINGDEAAIQKRVTRWKIQQPVDGPMAGVI